MDDPGSRSSHETKTPTLGGVSFFLALIGVLFFIRDFDQFEEAIYFVPALTVIFIAGLKDDLVSISPRAKLLAQLCAIGFILYNSGFQIQSLNGFLGIHDIPVWLGVLLSGFLMIVVINAFNLIDGIDGLASMVGLVILGAYGTIFYLIDQHFYMLLCLALQGCLLAFLYYNLSIKRKIFMGDTGSLIVGFIISALTVRLLAMNPSTMSELPFIMENAPIVAISILIVPLFDTARVFTVRLLQKRSPFSADRNHIHHLFIDGLLLSHRRASFFISVLNFLFISFIVLMAGEIGYLELIGVFALSIALLCVVCYALKKNRDRLQSRSSAVKRLKSIVKQRQADSLTQLNVLRRNAG
ncbi:glycosyl transferase family protein [Zhouia amylolytica AD3]|uniref:Glycosyl transferase family protein n=2 Tax=Zhouia amylolytica TaxID=376730 RepID=W2UP45_9FLAO|nr:glycosyl transferase family protein [Zhouia amylolytica AD3]